MVKTRWEDRTQLVGVVKQGNEKWSRDTCIEEREAYGCGEDLLSIQRAVIASLFLVVWKQRLSLFKVPNHIQSTFNIDSIPKRYVPREEKSSVAPLCTE